MSKAPAMQFYWNDYLRDTRILTPATRGLWVDMLGFMWYAEERGKLQGTYSQYSRLLSCTESEASEAIKELSVTKVADVTHSNGDGNGVVTVVNRRMFREQKSKESTRLRVQRHRNGKNNEGCNGEGNGGITVPSSTSSSSSKRIKNNTASADAYSHDFELFWTDYPKHTGKKAAFTEWKRLINKPPVDAILGALRAQKRNKAELQQAGKFVSEWPDPERWLKKERWTDEIELINPSNGPPVKEKSPWVICPSCHAEVADSSLIDDGCYKCKL